MYFAVIARNNKYLPYHVCIINIITLIDIYIQHRLVRTKLNTAENNRFQL